MNQRRSWMIALAVVPIAVAVPLLATSAAPSGGARGTQARTPVRAAGLPRCFGAPSRDPLAPCRNARLRLLVEPTPAEALRPPSESCPVIFSLAGKAVCRFGVAPAQAQRSVALVGDSHAGMWRWPLDPVARALGWTGVRIGHASCPLSKALRDIPEPHRSHCARWKRAVFAWFRQHPQVSAVFVSELSSGSGVVPTHGRSGFETSIAGYEAAWRALPSTIRHIVVIRDTPKALATTAGCVERAISRGIAAGPACAVPRTRALPRDPAAIAARRLRSRRVQVLDLTRIFCGPHTCLPVVGGALVHKDTTHLTPTFAKSLEEPLLRRVRPLAQAW